MAGSERVDGSSSREGDGGEAADSLLPELYGELRKLAAARMSGERRDHTLQATALVHEAWLRLAGPGGEPARWNDARHFFGAASEAMRRILIEHARRRKTARRGGDLSRVTLGDVRAPVETDPADLIDLDAALHRLQNDDPEEAELARLRIFGGLSMEEAAAVLGVSASAVKRRWAYIKARLSRDLSLTDES